MESHVQTSHKKINTLHFISEYVLGLIQWFITFILRHKFDLHVSVSNLTIHTKKKSYYVEIRMYKLHLKIMCLLTNRRQFKVALK